MTYLISTSFKFINKDDHASDMQPMTIVLIDDQLLKDINWQEVRPVVDIFWQELWKKSLPNIQLSAISIFDSPFLWR